MPYIKDENNRRKELRDGAVAKTAGELNYQIFSYTKKCGDRSVCFAQISDYVDDFLGDSPNYQKYNDMTGALVRCFKEIKRRLGFALLGLLDIMDSYDIEIDKYEDIKIEENGDV